MKKVDRIRDLLMEEYTPRQVAERVPCSLSLVFDVRGKRELAVMKHQVAELRHGHPPTLYRLAPLEGKPIDIVERFQQQRHA